MAEAVQSTERKHAQPQSAGPYAIGWAMAISARHRTFSHRIAAAAASAVVMTPIIGITTILGWLCAYLMIIGIERTVIKPEASADGSGPRGLRGFLYNAILFVSASTFAWIVIPLWFVAGLFGGLCATLYLCAGMIQSIINGAGSLRVTLITAIPTGLSILATPWILNQQNVDPNAIVAITTGCFVFIGICYGAARRLYFSDQARRVAYALAESKRLEAEAAVDARTTFLSTIAHDLRTPISAILTGAETLKADSSVSGRDQLTMIAEAGQMMNSLLNDLLDQARINAGRLTLNEDAFDLRRMLAQTARLWQEPIRSKGLQLQLDIARDLPRALIGDEVRLRQVLNNLMSNALKFTEEGTITLRCGGWLNEAGNYALTLEVQDTGPGMQADQLERMFVPFDQISNDVTNRHGGFGLGMPICRDLVRLMEGRLTARSTPAEGTIMTVALTLSPAEDEAVKPAPANLDKPYTARLQPQIQPQIQSLSKPAAFPEPVEEPDSEAARALELECAPETLPQRVAEPAAAFEVAQIDAVPDLSHEQAGPMPEDEEDNAPLRVLIVDDHEINRRAIQLILQSFDCDISMAADGRSALEISAQNAFDVIFMDVRMPELDGRETTRRLRKGGGLNANTPVIAVTADNAPEDQLACASAGMSAYLAKPLTPASLIATLQSTLEQTAQQQQAA